MEGSFGSCFGNIYWTSENQQADMACYPRCPLRKKSGQWDLDLVLPKVQEVQRSRRFNCRSSSANCRNCNCRKCFSTSFSCSKCDRCRNFCYSTGSKYCRHGIARICGVDISCRILSFTGGEFCDCCRAVDSRSSFCTSV